MITTYDYVIIAVYLAFMLSLGFIFRGLNKNTSDYFRCGGSMPWWITGTSAWIAGFSAWTFVGAAGEVYRSGYTVLPAFYAAVPAMAVVLMFTCIRFRRLRVVTWMEAVRERYGPFTEQFYTWLKVPIQLLLAAMSLMAISVFMAAVFQRPVWQIQVVLGAVITIIAFTGGAFAVLASDFVQMILVMTITLVMVVLIFWLPEIQGADHATQGGVTGVLHGISGLYHQIAQQKPNHLYWWEQFRLPVLMTYLLAFVAVKFTEQNNLENATMYLMPKSDKHARRMAIIPLIGTIIGPLIWTIPPLAGALLFTQADLAKVATGPDFARVPQVALTAPLGPADLQAQKTLDDALVHLQGGLFGKGRADVAELRKKYADLSAGQKANVDALEAKVASLPKEPTESVFVAVAGKVMPVGLLGLLLCAMFGATLTSMDAGVNKLTGVFVRSFYRPVLKPRASETHLLVAGKICTLVFGGIIITLSVIVASLRNQDLFSFMNQLGMSLGVPLVLPLLFGFFYKRTPAWSAVVTVLVCAVVVFWANFIFKNQIADPDFAGNLPGFLKALLGNPDHALTGSEQGLLLFSVTALGTIFVGTITFFGTSLFYRRSSPEHVARVEALFARVRVPVESSARASLSDAPLYRLLGALCMVYGCIILALMAIPNTLQGRLCFLFVGGTMGLLGLLLFLISRRKRRQAGMLEPVAAEAREGIPR